MSQPFTFVIIAALGLTISCAKTPEHYIAKGDAYFAQHKYDEAAVEYANAAITDPKNGLARMRLADAYMAADDVKRAFPEFIAAADLMPDNMEAQLRAGHMLLKGGLFNEAKTRARTVLQREPGNIQGLLLLANSLGGLKNLDDAIGVVQRAVTIDPERAALYMNLGVFELANGDRAQAEATFRKAVEVSHGAPDALVGLGNYYRATERPADAERELTLAVKAGPRHQGANQALANFYIETNRAALAEPYLKMVAEVSGDVSAQFALANYYATQRRPEDAYRILNGVALDEKQFAPAKRDIALVQFMMGQRREAHATIDEVLAREPLNAEALTMKARLLLADSQPDAALEAAKAAAAANYKLAEAQLTLGRIYLVRRDPEAARHAFAEALSRDPTLLSAQIELVDLHRKRGELDAALRFAEDAVKLHPQSLPARLSRLKILLMQRDTLVRVQSELHGLLAKYPTSPDVHVAMASYYLNQGDADGSRREFQRALELNPASIDGLTGLVSLDVLSKRGGDARARVLAQLAQAPNSVKLLLLAAKLYHVDGDLAKTEELLRRAIKADPSDPQPYGLLADMYMSQHRTTEAIKEFTEVARLDTHWVGAPTMLGMLEYQAQHVEQAKAWWEKAIAIDPNAAAASNNLAWVLADANVDLDRALQLATAANGKLPDQPEVVDTLGWIYYKKDLLGQARQLLQTCVDAEPNNVTYQFHMGMIYAKAGEDAKAGRALKLALSLDPKFPGADVAKRTLATLVY